MSLTEIERDVIEWNTIIRSLPEFIERVESLISTLDSVLEREGGDSAVTLAEPHPFDMGFLLSHGYVAIDSYDNSEGNKHSTLFVTRKGGNIMSAYHCPKGLKVRLICE